MKLRPTAPSKVQKGPDSGGRKPGRPRQLGIAWRDVERLAAKGAALDDIVGSLEIPAAGVEQHRDRLDRVVAVGHATFRIALADRLHREAVRKGRANALIAAAKAWLPAYTDALGEPQPPEAGVLAQLEAALERVKQRRRRASK